MATLWTGLTRYVWKRVSRECKEVECLLELIFEVLRPMAEDVCLLMIPWLTIDFWSASNGNKSRGTQLKPQVSFHCSLSHPKKREVYPVRTSPYWVPVSTAEMV